MTEKANCPSEKNVLYTVELKHHGASGEGASNMWTNKAVWKSRWAKVLLLTFVLLPLYGMQAQGLDVLRPSTSLLEGKELVQALKEGGYVIYFRHAKTDRVVEKWDKLVLEDCATQRNLSEESRQQARRIGASFAALGIPVAKVLTSPWCRCVDTARLAFGDFETSHDLRFPAMEGVEEFQRVRDALREMLSTPPPGGYNTVLVSHSTTLMDAVGINPKPEGVALIFKPYGDGTCSYVATVPPSEWDRLLAFR